VEFLDRLENFIRPRKRWPAGIAKASLSAGIPVEEQAREGRALCCWGAPGFGTLVRQGKQRDSRFDDRLVEASARLIASRWRPRPPAAWIACIPSYRRPDLVPDFARRLGQRLGIPFVDCIRKARDNEPQKNQANSFQQARNVAGAFTVDRAAVRNDPVLLVDDMVDSRWTFTAAAVLLRRAGSGPVYPFALADSSSENVE
jgi:ATP-dependent DNA helicase RecQ